MSNTTEQVLYQKEGEFEQAFYQTRNEPGLSLEDIARIISVCLDDTELKMLIENLKGKLKT